MSEPLMSIVVAALLLVSAGVLLLGVLGIIRELPDLDGQGEPSFQDTQAMCNGLIGNEGSPICNDGSVDNQQARSQFAWQSRSHFRAPD
jgi:hypothetical protein